jgi:methylmalonyl-CoA/ethylmalonyl-CoA epimerase
MESNFFGDSARLHHVGMVVKSIKEVDESFEVTEDKTQKVFISFVNINGVQFELLESAGEDSPVNESFKKGTKLLHVCYEVDNLDAAIGRSREFGFHCVSRLASAPALGGKLITWLYHKHYGLFEIVER